MALYSAAEMRFAKAVSNLVYCNIYLPERIQYEREALGEEFVPQAAPWNVQVGSTREPPNVATLRHKLDDALERAAQRLAQGVTCGAEELRLYGDVFIFRMYYRWRTQFDQIIVEGIASRSARRKPMTMYESFAADSERFLNVCAATRAMQDELPRLFAIFFQLRRAYYNISNYIIGRSRAAVALRAAAWQSIFSHDMRRYRRLLYDRMADFATLIIGPSGTGKELVARAIGLSRYIPFDSHARTFTEDFAGSFYPVNLPALSPTLIESELFGHKRGAFTGAVNDRGGWLEVCPPLGSVFLDEIGELDPAIQVKLLRVLQTRTFSRLGETETRQFHGKIIAATNRDLNTQLEQGRFREDLYYRLCSDIIVAPSLRERLAEDPTELHTLIDFLARGIVGDEAPKLAAEVETWIRDNLSPHYEWPGNIRELEQCMRNVLIRKSYQPRQRRLGDPTEQLVEAMRTGQLTADEVLRRYCTIVYAQTNNYEETARRLKLDRRTVKAKIDEELLAQLRGEFSAAGSRTGSGGW